MKIQIEHAARRNNRFLRVTPLERCPFLSKHIDGAVYLKMEIQQVSGSFKARGAYNKILSVPERERGEGFFAAVSTGNHAAGFCHALQKLGLKGKVYLPKNIALAKLDFISSFGVEIEQYGDTSLQTELYCRRQAEEHGYILVHPYNDPEIIAGQGTIGLELIDQLPEIDVVIVPVGGGGLISGIASYLKSVKPDIRVVGCQPEMSPEMIRSIEQGSILTDEISKPTLSDSTAGGLEPNSITFPISQDLVDDWLLISEEEMANEIRWMIDRHQCIIEGSAAMSIASVRRLSDQLGGRHVVAIICGKRISSEKLKKILCG